MKWYIVREHKLDGYVYVRIEQLSFQVAQLGSPRMTIDGPYPTRDAALAALQERNGTRR